MHEQDSNEECDHLIENKSKLPAAVSALQLRDALEKLRIHSIILLETLHLRSRKNRGLERGDSNRLAILPKKLVLTFYPLPKHCSHHDGMLFSTYPMYLPHPPK